MRRCVVVLLLGLTLPLAAGYTPLTTTSEWLINTYKGVLSPLQGRQMCNFWPTCSQFTKQAIQSYGFDPGVVMGTDRLLRCQQFAWSGYKRCYLSISHDRLADPVGNHWVGHARIDEPANLTTVGVQSTPAPDTTPTSPEPNALAFADYLYAHDGMSAVRHLFRVTSGRVAVTQTAVVDSSGSLEPLWFAGNEPILVAGEVRGPSHHPGKDHTKGVTAESLRILVRNPG